MRERLGFSQEALSLAADLDRTYVSGVERGSRNPTLKTIHRLARALDLSLAELFANMGAHP